MLASFQGLSDSLLQRATDAAVQWQALHIKAQHARRAGPPGALVHTQQAVAAGQGVMQGFQRRCGGAEQDRDVLLVSAYQCQVAGVVPQAFLLFIGAVVLFVDDDQAGVFFIGVNNAERVPMMISASPSRAASQASSVRGRSPQSAAGQCAR